MQKPPAALRTYITVVALAATVVGLALLRLSALPSGFDWLVAGQVAALVALARCYPVHLAPKSKFSLDTAPTIAALFLLPPAYAVLSVGVGMLAGELWLRARSLQAVLNVSVAILRTAAGIAVLGLAAGGSVHDASLGRAALALLPAILAMLTLSILLVDIAVGLTLRRRFSAQQVWLRHRSGLGHEVTLAMLGLVCAYATMDVPWVLGLMAVPGALIYRSLRDGVALRQRMLTTLTQLADLTESGGLSGRAHGERVGALCIALAEALPVRDSDLIAATAQAGRLHQLAALGGGSGVGERGAALAASLLSGEAAAAIVRHQSDRWDGAGAARGSRGARLPLGARILAVADAYDHLTVNTNTPVSSVTALTILKAERGRRYDPAVVDALATVLASGETRGATVLLFPVAATG